MTDRAGTNRNQYKTGIKSGRVRQRACVDNKTGSRPRYPVSHRIPADTVVTERLKYGLQTLKVISRILLTKQDERSGFDNKTR